MEPTAPGRLSILYLLSITAGVGVAISIARGIEYVRFPADATYYRLEHLPEFDATGMLVAATYGVCVTTFLFAARTGSFWSSPGKILAMLFATMCVLDWSLELAAALVTSYRIQQPIVPGMPDQRGFLFGIWYRQFAVSIGYVAALPLLLLVIYKTHHQRLSWQLVWWGFLIFASLTLGFIYWDLGTYVPMSVRPWTFEASLGIPVVLLALALLDQLLRRELLDWWTAILAPLIVTGWILGVTIKAANA